MVNIYVLNQDFTIEGIVDSYVSVIWRPSYSDIGDFELYLGASYEAVQLLQRNRYVVRDKDISVDDAGKVTYKNVMIIKNIDLVTDVENGDFLTVTGKELKYILHQRIVWNQTNLTGTAEAGIVTLLNNNAINPTDNNRVIPTLSIGTMPGASDAIEKQVTGDYLDDTIKEICTAYGYGWEIYIFNSAFVFRTYLGLDRSYDQTERPYVVFSDTFDNLYNTDYQMNSENYANTTLVGGEGEGTERKYTTVNNSNAGLNRYEYFTDARDLSQNLSDSDTSKHISDANYNKMLQERGREKLAELSITEGFSGEVLSDVAFEYGVDFFLGDIVTVINSYGISKNVMVMSAIESQDENGEKLIPEFNI